MYHSSFSLLNGLLFWSLERETNNSVTDMDRKRCKTIEDDHQIPLMNVSQSHGGVRRSRDTDFTSSDSTKRIKFDPRDQENQENVAVQLEIQCRSGVDVDSPEDVVSVSSAESGDHDLSSSCFKHDLSLDLKAELRYETETFISGNDGFSRESSPSSEICLDSDEMESSSTLKTQPPPPPPAAAAASRRKQSPAANIPTAAEIDEFFSVMEKKEQNRFAEKYNYDIVNDVPMEGRYQWVLLKQ